MMTSVSLKQILLDKSNTTYSITEKLLNRICDSKLSWVPPVGRSWMTMGQLLMHCACFGCGKAVQGFVKGDWGMPEASDDAARHIPAPEALPTVTNLKQALNLLAEDKRLTIQCLNELKESDLLTKRCIAPWGGPELSLFQQLTLMIEHLAQHKGQLFYYLKMMGKDVSTSDLWGE